MKMQALEQFHKQKSSSNFVVIKEKHLPRRSLLMTVPKKLFLIFTVDFLFLMADFFLQIL